MIVFAENIAHALSVVKDQRHGSLFYIIDHNVEKLHNISSRFDENLPYLICNTSEKDKDTNKLFEIIDFFHTNNVTRSDAVVVIGGGVLTDISGFACSIYKRGINYINVPTTLIGMVDAAIGGKTAINYNNMKNMLGSFYMPEKVVISLDFIHTVDEDQLMSGYGELLKYSLLIDNDYFRRFMQSDDFLSITTEEMSFFVREAVNFKDRIVKDDFRDRGIRQCLNAGHTIAHALEYMSMTRNYLITHGKAVSIGLVVELYIAMKALGTPRYLLDSIIYKVKQQYSHFVFPCRDIDIMLDALIKDKKNNGKGIVFSLIKDIGICEVMPINDLPLIREGIDFYLDVFGY